MRAMLVSVVAVLMPGAAAANSAGMLSSVGGKLASKPMRPLGPARCTASLIMASFGFRTGMLGSAWAQASMQGPKAEQVKRMPAAPVLWA